MGAIF